MAALIASSLKEVSRSELREMQFFYCVHIKDSHHLKSLSEHITIYLLIGVQ